LADWITKLEPTFTQVWLVQSWNMTYNIAVKFTDYADRWRWVQRGIELLRDDGLRYNPTEALLYRELAWFYQHKIGQNLDDGHLYYKTALAREMMQVLGSGHPDFDELLAPKSDESKRRVALLRDKYKMEPQEMKEVDQLYGPLEWRLRQSHALYWPTLGLKRSKKKDLITLRRVIYQSMQMAVLRGRLVSVDPIYYDADLSKVDRANAAYEQMIEEDVEMRDAIKKAHRTFLREVVYLLYTHNRLGEANQWLARVRQKYPDAIPAGQSLEEYALQRVLGNLAEPSHDRTKAILAGVILKYFLNVALDDDAQADAYDRMAQKIRQLYENRIKARKQPLAFPPLPEMKRTVLEQFLNPQSRFNPELQARLRTRLALPPPANVSSTTNAPGAKR